MKKRVSMLVALLALLILSVPGPAVQAQQITGVVSFPLMSEYDLDSTSYTYCVTTGQGGRVLSPGRPGAGRIKSAAASTTVTSFTTSSGALDVVAVGDELEINGPSFQNGSENPVIFRYLTAVASDNSVTVNSAVTLTQTGGHGYLFRQRSCGTAATSGWWPMRGMGYATVQFDVAQLTATGGITYKVECRVQGAVSNPVIVSGPTVMTAATDGPDGIRVQGPWDECRLGFKITTSDDGSDTGVDIEKLNAYVEVRR